MQRVDPAIEAKLARVAELEELNSNLENEVSQLSEELLEKEKMVSCHSEYTSVTAGTCFTFTIFMICVTSQLFYPLDNLLNYRSLGFSWFCSK